MANTSMQSAFESTGITAGKARENFLGCIHNSQFWFIDLFRVPPVSESAKKKFLKGYHDYVDGYNRGGRASAGFKDILDVDKLPVDFLELSGILGYRGDNIMNAWLFVFDIIKEDKNIDIPEGKKTYVSEVFTQNIGGQVMNLLNTQRPSDEDLQEAATYMEELLVLLEWHFIGYTKDDPIKKRIESLYYRLSNAIFYNKKKGDYKKLREALNQLEGKIREIKK